MPLDELGRITQREKETLRGFGIDEPEEFWLASKTESLDRSESGPLGMVTGKPGRRSKWIGSGVSAYSGSELEDDFESAEEIHANRSPQSRNQDNSMLAPTTFDLERWEENKDRFDFVGVDTPKGFEFGDK